MAERETKGIARASGVEFAFRAINARYGRAPSHVWMAMPCDPDDDPDRAFVALVGHESVVSEFIHHARTPQMPRGIVTVSRESSFGVVIVGTWPVSQAEAAVRDISGGGSFSSRNSATAFRRRRLDTDRKQHGALSVPLTKILVEIYVDQCIRLTAN